MLEPDLLQELIDELESTPDGKTEMDAARKWVKVNNVLQEFFVELVASQQRLPPEFEKILYDNLWELYD